MDLSAYEEDDIEQLLHEQATILFKQCDYGDKNYVTLDDLLTLASELDLSHEQVTEAFHRLNTNNNDFLTLREFVNGFGLFLGIEPQSSSIEADTVNNEDLDKAIELFNACDINNRGYVSLQDLLKLKSSLGLTQQQISDIFKKLDSDDNGFLTLDEFIAGFSKFTADLNNSHGKSTSKTNCRESLSSETEGNIKNKLKKERAFDEIYFQDSSTYANTVDSLRDEDLQRSDSIQSATSERSFITRHMSIRYESGVDGEVNEMLTGIEKEFGR